MNDLISRDALRDALGITGTADSCKGCMYDVSNWTIGCARSAPSFDYVCAAIDDAPTIDAVTVADIIEVEKERNYWHDLADSYERTILKLTKALEEANRGRKENERE